MEDMEEKYTPDATEPTAKEIYGWLEQMAKEGKLTSKTKMGKEYYRISTLYAEHKLYATSVESIDATEPDIQKAFEMFREDKRILTKRDVMVRSGLVTLYDINRAVKDGGLLRFDRLGRSSILYIV